MNESALNALINLFAIFSIKGNLDFENGKNNITEYLERRLGLRNSGEYVSLFFELYELYNLSPEILSESRLQGLINQVCSQLKSKIPHSEQLIVFLHFLELTSLENIEIDDRYYRQVGDIFEIPEEEYLNHKRFIFCNNPGELQNDGFLLIGNINEEKNVNASHIKEDSLDGIILVYYLKEIKQFVFKLYGPDILMLEGTSIREGHFYTLNQGSIIRGQYKTSIYYSDITRRFFNLKQKSPITFSAADLSFYFPGSKNGLQNFSFSENSGQLIAVMGGSGVGKSTLLNVLNGSLEPTTGNIRINELDIHRDFNKTEGIIGYVPQDDLVISELTVFQNVYYNACLCLDHLQKEEIVQKVDNLLVNLDLFEIRDRVVGSPLKKVLSGGQRKRLNIALELVREPSILFVDEPTSGLSSRDSERIMVLLKEQALEGRLVIVNIHQPSSFIYKLFDKLWILDKGGYPVYAGNPIDAVIYFKKLANHIDSENCECPACGNVNPEQVLDIVESNRIDASGKLTDERVFTPQELYSLYCNKIQNNIITAQSELSNDLEANLHKPGRFKQFRIFSTRNLHSKLSNKQYVLINLLQAPLLALIVGLLTRYAGDEGYFFGLNKNFPSFVFMAVVVMLFQGMSLSAEEIIRDRALLQRESFLRLSRFSYLNSKIIFLFMVSAFQSLLFTLTSFLILNMGGLFLQYWLILFLTAAFANMAGLVISAGLNSVVTIYISIPLLIIPQILLCGLIVPFEDIQSNNARKNVVPIIGDLMVSRWAFEALAVNQFINNKYTVNYFDIDKEKAGYRINKLVITELGNLAQTARFELATDGDIKKAEQLLKVVRRELSILDSDGLTDPFSLKLLYPDVYNPLINDSLQAHFEKLSDLNDRLLQSADSYRDKITYALSDSIGPENISVLQDKHDNLALGSLLKRDTKRSDMIEVGSRRIMVNIGPVYRNPESKLGRAHFYAPFKQIGEMRFSTLGFNSLFILFMTAFLYLALYYNWLGKVLNSWETIKRRYGRK